MLSYKDPNYIVIMIIIKLDKVSMYRTAAKSEGAIIIV